CVCCLGINAVAMAAEATNLPLIAVTGTAVTEVKPDVLNWAIEVKNIGPELAKVADKHAAAATALLDSLRELGIEDKNIQTTQVELGPNRIYRNGEQEQEGYFATTSVTFKTTNLAKYKEVWLRLAAQTGVSVQSVAFDHSRRIEITKETRIKALHAAQEKAAAMAEALDAKAGEVMSIAEDQYQFMAFAANSNNAVSDPAQRLGDEGGAIAAGTIPIKVRVNVSFRLLNGAK
ncbi:MAG: hypothetical protein JWO94_2476, partial [Verrucomicrobiaceae bacterium]|nr:hypothetical protein [Verrucomicrobiaceae bacterium]